MVWGVLIMSWLAMGLGQSLLSSVVLSAQGNPTYSEYSVSRNNIGVSNYMSEIVDHMENELLQEYLQITRLGGSWDNTFSQTIHSSPGFKYDCPILDGMVGYNVTNCTYDLKNNQSHVLKTLGDFGWNTTNYWGHCLGWDNEHADFTNNTYVQDSFFAWYQDFYWYSQAFLAQLVDMGDKWVDYGDKNYNVNLTVLVMIQMCQEVNDVGSGVQMVGPGTTANATADWYSSNDDIYQFCGTFSGRVIAFPDPSLLTIPNLLSDNYTKQLLARRFTVNGGSYLNDFNDYLGMLNDIRLVEDEAGIDGLTNSFAAAIWLVDFALESAFIGVHRQSYFNPISQPSFQAILGQAPTFNSTILFQALLFSVLALRDYPYILKPTITAGTSSNIKIFGLDPYFGAQGFVILNKDTNSSLIGYVEVALSTDSELHCNYFSASSLASTSASLSGLSWGSNSSQSLGVYEVTRLQKDSLLNGDPVYKIPLNYSQMVYCSIYVPQQSNIFSFPKGRSSQTHLIISVVLLILLSIVL